MKIYKSAIPLFIFFALISCKPPMKKMFISNPEYLQGHWKLTSIFQDTSIMDNAFGEKKPVITIDYAKHLIHGFSGCNSFSGAFELKNDSIKILPLNFTQIGCIKNGENSFFKQLCRTSRFRVSDDSLEFLKRIPFCFHF